MCACINNILLIPQNPFFLIIPEKSCSFYALLANHSMSSCCHSEQSLKFLLLSFHFYFSVNSVRSLLLPARFFVMSRLVHYCPLSSLHSTTLGPQHAGEGKKTRLPWFEGRCKFVSLSTVSHAAAGLFFPTELSKGHRERRPMLRLSMDKLCSHITTPLWKGYRSCKWDKHLFPWGDRNAGFLLDKETPNCPHWKMSRMLTNPYHLRKSKPFIDYNF